MQLYKGALRKFVSLHFLFVLQAFHAFNTPFLSSLISKEERKEGRRRACAPPVIISLF